MGTGSANETYGGMVANFESVQVYRSWLPEDLNEPSGIKSNFDSLWVGATPEALDSGLRAIRASA